MFKIVLILFLLLATPYLVSSQSYSLESFQDKYVEIEEYSSLLIDIGGFSSDQWMYRFDLEFEFPYYDTSYSYIYAYSHNLFNFDSQSDWIIRLFSVFTRPKRDFDILDIQSDIRYKQTISNGLKCLVLQHTNVKFVGDPSVEDHDSYLNFQQWFFEDGSIEVRFGEMNLAHSPGFVPGEGYFLFLSNDLLIPLLVSVGIANSQKSDGVFISGTHDDFDVLDYEHVVNGLKSLPPEGWVIRIEPQPSNVEDLSINKVQLYPNPVENKLVINPVNEIPSRVEIIDLMGNVVYNRPWVSNKVNLSHLPAGMYVVRLKFRDRYLKKSIIIHP